MASIAHEIRLFSLPTPTSMAFDKSLLREGSLFFPKEKAKKTLEIMKFLSDLGLKVAILPPHERPHMPTLRALGFQGPSSLLPSKVWAISPSLLASFSSSVTLDLAPSVTITSSIDSLTSHLHFTPSNFMNYGERVIEPPFTTKALKTLFPESLFFTHHPPLPSCLPFLDRGSTNAFRLSRNPSELAINLFTFGEEMEKMHGSVLKERPALQMVDSSYAHVRNHSHYDDRTLFAKLHPEAIAEGALFGCQLLASTRAFLFFHEKTFHKSEEVLKQLRDKLKRISDVELQIVMVKEKEIPLSLALHTHLFESLLVSLPDGAISIIASASCERSPHILPYLQHLAADPNNPIRDLHFFDIPPLSENFGLSRLTLPLTLSSAELEAVNPFQFMNESLFEKLNGWIESHFREEIVFEDLLDPSLIEENEAALADLLRILDVSLPLYSFQEMP